MDAPQQEVGELRSWRVGDYTEKTEREAFGHLLALSLERIKELVGVYRNLGFQI
jgi:hypothetical protein